LGTVPFQKLGSSSSGTTAATADRALGTFSTSSALEQPTRPAKGRRRRVRTEAVMNQRQRKQYWTLYVLWLLFSVYFWQWWALPSHAGSWGLFIVLSVAWFYSTTLLPTFYLFYLGCMRRPATM